MNGGNNLHIAYIHQHFSTKQGATGTRSYEMSQRLIGAGHRVTMICGVNDNTQSVFQISGRVNEMEIDGIRVLCIAEPYSNRMGFWRRVLAFRRFMSTAGKLVKRLDADLVFATSTPLTVGVPGMKGARALGVPFVFEVRDLWPELPIALGVLPRPLIPYLRHLERKIYRAARHIIALAPGIADGIAKTGYPREKITLIPNGCDLDLFRPSGEPLDDPRFGTADDFRLVFTGAHGLANGLDAVLDAVRELKHRGVRGVRFVFIGRGGLRDKLMQRSRDEGTIEMISWVESMPKEELARLLPRMDVGMMILKNVPSFYYGTSPNKFFDYIACGIPVLNNYPGWLAGMIQENDCGVAVPPDDAKAFADAVLKLRDAGPAARRAMGQRGRQLAEREFSRDKLATAFVQTLESVHASAGG